MLNGLLVGLFGFIMYYLAIILAEEANTRLKAAIALILFLGGLGVMGVGIMLICTFEN